MLHANNFEVFSNGMQLFFWDKFHKYYTIKGYGRQIKYTVRKYLLIAVLVQSTVAMTMTMSHMNPGQEMVENNILICFKSS